MDVGQRIRQARQKALKKLAVRDRSEKELRELLMREGFSESETEDAVEYARSFGYVNDRRYAENYVMSAGRKKSRAALRSFLLEKGIPAEYTEEALAEFAEDESGLIRELIRKKSGPPHAMEEAELRRVYAYLARRGFSSGDIWRELKNFQETEGYSD